MVPLPRFRAVGDSPPRARTRRRFFGEAAAEVKPAAGTVVAVFTTGTIVHYTCSPAAFPRKPGMRPDLVIGRKGTELQDQTSGTPGSGSQSAPGGGPSWE